MSIEPVPSGMATNGVGKISLGGSAPTGVSHQQTIRRELVHRTSISEVFVTSLSQGHRASSDADFVAGAQLPRMHAYFGDHRGAQYGRHDPLVLMETARQAAIATTHEFFDVPLDSAFLVRQFNGVTHANDGADAAAWEVGNRPTDIDIALRVNNRHMIAERLRGLDMVIELSWGGTMLMTVDGSFSWTSPQQWRGLRAQARAGAAPGPVWAGVAAQPHDVGRVDARNVVIGPVVYEKGQAIAEIVTDTGHPGLFDHDLDHLPGSLMLEACRQLAIAHFGDGVRLGSVRSTFGQFVELDRPSRCVLVPDPAPHERTDGVRSAIVTISQEEQPCVHARLEVLDAAEQ